MSITQVLSSRQVDNVIELYHFTFYGTDYYFTNYHSPVKPDAGTPIYQPYYLVRGEIIEDLTVEAKELVIEAAAKNDLFKKAAIFKGMIVRVSMAFLPDYPGDTFKEPAQIYYGEQTTESFSNDKETYEFIFLQYDLRALNKYALSKRPQKRCNNLLFDRHCALTKATYETLVTVDSVNKNTIEAAFFATKPSGYYYLGEATLVKDGITERRMISGHSGDAITTSYNFTNIEAGDQITVTPGCDKKAETCFSKFSNILNFSGMPYLPEETK